MSALAVSILGPPQHQLHAIHVANGVRKPKRIMEVCYDWDTNKTPAGCLKCLMSDGFHIPGCPNEFQ